MPGVDLKSQARLDIIGLISQGRSQYYSKIELGFLKRQDKLQNLCISGAPVQSKF